MAGGGGWSLRPQPYHPYPLATLLPSLGLILLLGLPIAWLAWPDGRPLPRWRAGLAVALLGVLAFGLQITLDWGTGGLGGWLRNAVASTWSTLSNGYFFAAVKIDSVADFLRHYHEIQSQDAMKLGTHPPGAVLVYWVPLKIYSACRPLRLVVEHLCLILSANDPLAVHTDILRPPNVPREMPYWLLPPTVWCIGFLAAVGASAVVPTYWLGALGGHRRRGILAAALLTMAPNTLFYYLSLDVVLMTLTAWGLVGVLAASRGERPRYFAALLGGLGFGAAMLISLGAVAAVAIVAAYLAVAARRGTVSVSGGAAIFGAMVAGMLIVLGAATVAGLQTVTVLEQCLEAHEAGAGGIRHRHYLPWVLFNPIDYALLLGIPLSFVAVEGIVRGELDDESLKCLGYATLVAMLLLNLSGTVRGETERIWLFFNPALAASAAAVAGGRAERLWPLLCQPLQLLLMALALPPLVRPY